MGSKSEQCTLAAGIQRPAFTSRPGLAEQSQQQQLSTGAADSVWQEPPIVFHGADDASSASTPASAKLGQLMKKGMVKFKEVGRKHLLVSYQHQHLSLDLIDSFLCYVYASSCRQRPYAVSQACCGIPE